jgi:NAD/NADP transhydrogenase beta subunit
MYILAFFSSLFFVGLKSVQQLNVVHKQYWWILPTSMAMAACEVVVVASMATNGWGWIVLAVGLGAGLGASIATWLHDKLITKGEKSSGR